MEMYILIGIVLVIIFVFIYSYNTIVQRKNEVENAYGSIDVMLKKRFDLLPNLIELTKEYMGHEKEILTQITELRSSLGNNQSTNEKIKKHNKLQKNAGTILINMEQYPELRSNQNFIMLHKTWNTTEEQLSASRRYFNSAVTRYNNSIEVFPNNIVAAMFNFYKRYVFEVGEEIQNIHAKDVFSN